MAVTSSDMAVEQLKTIFDERAGLRAQRDALAVEVEELKQKLKEVASLMEMFEAYKDILEDPPSRAAITITDSRLAVMLEMKTRKVFGRAAARPGMDENQLRRAERLNRDIVASAAMKSGLVHWDRTYSEFIAPLLRRKDG